MGTCRPPSYTVIRDTTWSSSVPLCGVEFGPWKSGNLWPCGTEQFWTGDRTARSPGEIPPHLGTLLIWARLEVEASEHKAPSRLAVLGICRIQSCAQPDGHSIQVATAGEFRCRLRGELACRFTATLAGKNIRRFGIDSSQGAHYMANWRDSPRV